MGLAAFKDCCKCHSLAPPRKSLVKGERFVRHDGISDLIKLCHFLGAEGIHHSIWARCGQLSFSGFKFQKLTSDPPRSAAHHWIFIPPSSFFIASICLNCAWKNYRNFTLLSDRERIIIFMANHASFGCLATIVSEPASP